MNTGSIPQRDAIELAKFKFAISLHADRLRRKWLRELDLNQRPLGYEPFQIETGANAPQTTPRKLALLMPPPCEG
jgi:hypothetical protein